MKEALKIVFNLILVSLFFANTIDAQVAKAQAKPNILFIMSDDHGYQAISAYSDKLVKTPNIDRIAKEGVLFTNACVANSICAPSRATILTGKHSHINGKTDNRKPFHETQMTFPQLFQKAGYQTAMYGKLHLGNSPKGFDDFMILPGQGDYFNPDFITNKGDITITGYATDIITDLTIDWLDKKRDKTKPFMLMYLQKAPHRPWWPSPEKFKEFSKKLFPKPESLFDDYSNRGTAAKTAKMNVLLDMKYSQDAKVRSEILKEMVEVLPKIPNGKSLGEDYGRLNPQQKALYDPIIDSISNSFKMNWPNMNSTQKMEWKYQRFMQDYLACVSSVDDNVGRVLDYLDESKLTNNTIVIYTSDQGFYLGEHGWFDKRFIYDESFKTPLLIRWPNVIKPGISNDEMVQNLDFAQTFLEAAKIEAPNDMQGESFMPLLKGHSEQWNRDAVYYHYSDFPNEHNVQKHYGIVTKEYKLVYFYDKQEWELYDRKKDPQEMKNVINDSSYATIVKDLKIKLKKLREKYKDNS